MIQYTCVIEMLLYPADKLPYNIGYVCANLINIHWLVIQFTTDLEYEHVLLSLPSAIRNLLSNY